MRKQTFVRTGASRTAARRRVGSAIEPLEERQLMAADLRSYDGTSNNLSNPQWGSTDEALLRIAAAEYADGLNTPAGADRPSARAISNAVVAETEERTSDRDLSALVYAWGQFIDHDLDLTSSATPYESLPVTMPTGDEYFDPTSSGNVTMGMNRSKYDHATGVTSPREQTNDITAYLDGSMIYGSSAERALALRTLSGGRLKTSDGGLLPYNTLGLPNDNALGADPTTLFVAGDVRANENVELTALHTLFVREHNRLADQIATANPRWSDERVFQQTRRIVVAELQAITYNEFLPALMGSGALSRYRGYDASVNPGIANEFSTAAFRLGHSMLGADVEFLDNDGQETHEEVALRDAFFNPSLLSETGIDSILKYLASDPAREIDSQIVDDVRNFLFGPPGAGGFDLASLNIQRGRDHGLADYNATRVAYGLPAVTSFSQITRDAEVQAALEEMYGDVDDVDLWVGGLAEAHIRGGSLGPLFTAIVADQFERLRDGDRFWYERDLNRRELAQVRSTSLADVISRNTTTTNLQDDVFYFHTSISGTVSIAIDGPRRRGVQVIPLPGINVELVDAEGNVVASATTGRNGRYTFEDVDFGAYSVRLSLPGGLRQVSADPEPIEITRSQDVADVNFRVKLALRTSATSLASLTKEASSLRSL
jgi:hypothetical protein